MPKKGIYAKNKNRLTNSNDKDKEERLFNYMLNHKDECFTQKYLAEKLNFSNSTASRCVRELMKKPPMPYGQAMYKVVKTKEGYTVIAEYESDTVNEFEYDIDELRNPKIWLSDTAEEINDYVVLYKVNTRLAYIPKDFLKKKYGEQIRAILREGQDMYIILAENTSKPRLDRIRREIVHYYKGETD